MLVLLTEPINAEELHTQCIAQAFSATGYSSGVEQNLCEKEYPELPSPFRFLCISYIDRGFPTLADRLACSLYFKTLNMEKIAPKT